MRGSGWMGVENVGRGRSWSKSDAWRMSSGHNLVQLIGFDVGRIERLSSGRHPAW